MHKGFSIAFHPCHHPRLSSCISLWLWFAFFHRLMRMSTFSCVFDHLHIFFRELFKSSAHFKIVLSFCCWVIRVLHVRWTLDLYQTYDQRIFPVVLWVVFFSFLSLETILWHCSCLYVALSGDSQLFFCSCLGGRCTRSKLLHAAGPQSPTGDGARAPCAACAESQSLDHQGSPSFPLQLQRVKWFMRSF